MNMQHRIVFVSVFFDLTAICLHVFDAHHMSTLLFKMSTHAHMSGQAHKHFHIQL